MKNFTISPKMGRALFTLLCIMSMSLPLRMMGQETLTVYDSYSQNPYVPIHGEDCRYYLKMEFIIPSTDLAVMDGASIISLKFYATSSLVLWGDASFRVFLKEVDNTTVSGFSGTNDATIVYEGPLSVIHSEMEVPFTTDYEYHGGNLLVGFYNTVKGTSSPVYWTTKSMSYSSAICGWANSSLESINSGGRYSYLPKTTFTYANLGECPKPIYFSADVVGNRSAQLNWTQFGEVESWQAVCTTDPNLDPDTASSFEVASNSLELNNLTPSTTYYVYLRSVCGENSYSNWSDCSFTTLPSCIAPSNLTMSDMSSLVWTAGEEGQTNWDVFYTNDASVIPDGNTQSTLTHVGAPTVTLTGLDESQVYYAYVRANCGDGDVSDWSNCVSFNPSNAPQLTVNDGTATNNVMPINGYAGTGYTKTEFVIPAAELSAMNDSYISEMVLYGQGDYYTWQGRSYRVFMKEISGTTLSEFVGFDESEVVYSGKMDYSYYDDIMTVRLVTPYHYYGGNLLIGFYTLGTTSSYGTSTVNWEGEEVIGASLYGYKSSSETTYSCVQQNFLPKTTFTYSGLLAPSRINAQYVGMHTATLNWVPNEAYQGSNTGWELAYSSEEGFVPNSTNTLMINGGNNTLCDLAGLTPSTLYYVCVRSKNGDAHSPWSDVFTFRTAEYNPTLLNDDNPYYYDGFDGDTLEWTLANGGNHWMKGRSSWQSPPYAIYLSVSHSFIIDLSIPTKSYVYKSFELEGGKQYEVSFDWRCKPLHNTTDIFQFRIYPADVIIEGGEYPTGASPIINEWLEGDSKYYWYDYYDSFEIPEGEGGTYVAVFSWKSDQYGSGGYYYDNSASFDNFLINVYQGEAPRPTPPQPEPTEVTLQMEEMEVEPIAWQIIYSTDPELDPYTLDLSGFPDDLPEGVVGVESTEAAPKLEGLDPETGYYVYVRAVYPDVKKDEEERVFSRWSEQIAFTTTVSCFSVVDLDATAVGADHATMAWDTNEDQPLSNVPATWNVKYKKDVQAGATTTYTFDDGVNPAEYVENWSVKDGSLISAGYTSNNCIGFEIQLPCIVSFDAEGISANVSYSVNVCYNPQGGNVMASMSGTATDGVSQRVTFDFSGYAGTGYLVLSMSYQAPLVIDNLTLDVPVWTTGTANGNSFTMNGLDSKTDYLFAVQAHCGDGDDSQWETYMFRTQYGNMEIPYEEDFDAYSYGDIPDGWSVINNGQFPVIVNDFYHSSGYSLALYSVGEGDQYAILPPVENVSSLQMEFWSATPFSEIDVTTFTVGVMSDPEDPTTFVPVKTITTTLDWTKKVVYFTDYDGNGQYIAIQLTGEAETYKLVAIDDVRVSEAPSCFPPEDLTVNNITTTSAEFSWTPNGEETQWYVSFMDPNVMGEPIIYGFEDGEMPEGWETYGCEVVNEPANAYQGNYCLKTTAGEEPMMMIPLRLGTSASFYIKSTEEEISFTMYMTTDGDKWTPFYSGTATTSYAQHTLDLSAYAGMGMIGFDIPSGIVIDNIALPGEPVWSAPILVENNPYYAFNDLTPGSEYLIRVQAICAADDLSEWVETSFTTPFCEPAYQCAISYTLGDGWGDGWTGNTINIVDQATGTIVASITMDDQGVEDQYVEVQGTLPLCPGIYDFVWVSGQYSEECSFTVNDPNGNVIVYFEAGKDGPESGSLLEVPYQHICGDATYELEIVGYDDSEGGYYLIASPVTVDPDDMEDMTDGNFDLYWFDQTAADGLEWRNYEVEGVHFDLVPGMGYLYAHDTDVTLVFAGEPYDGDGAVSLVKDDEARFAGWNLVGNPFGVTAYIDRDYYVLNSDGSELTPGEGNEIPAMQGLFVIAEEDGEELQFSTEAPGGGGAKIVMNLTRNRGGVIDRAIVRMGEGRMLPKFQINPNSTKVFIHQGLTDYAVVNSAHEGEIPVSFKAGKEGSYTLTVNVEEVRARYLHLIDNKTGTDVDLLETPAYSFEGRTTDYTSRFKLVFECEDANDGDAFAYFNGSEWVVSNVGNATLQVVDMMGRVLISEAVSGNATVNVDVVPGVYMMRLVNGDNVKVQKVVVR